jgi:hypothetical protein
MPLPTSGALSLSNIQTEFGGTNPISLNEYYAGGAYVPAGTSGTNGAVPTSGTISILNFYGTQSVILKGYWGGGTTTTNATVVSAEIDGIQFSNETAINPSATLVIARHSLGAVNSSTKGYFVGGLTSISTYPFYNIAANEIDGILFSNESSINPSSTLPRITRGVHGSLNSSTKGYVATDSTYPSTIVDGLTFSTETTTTTAVNLSARVSTAGVNSSTKGYWGGGRRDATPEHVTEIDGILFSNETYINPSAGLAVGRYHLGGVNSTTRGYFAGGVQRRTSAASQAAAAGEIDGIQFDTEAAINPAATLPVPRYYLHGTNSTTRGYFAGGQLSTSILNEIDGIRFDTEAAINPAATLAVARRSLAGMQNGGIL